MKTQIISNGRRIKSNLDMTSGITPAEIKKLLKSLQWAKMEETEIDDYNDDGEGQMLASMYSRIQSFGSTDYKDHRLDNLDKLKILITKSLREGGQRLHFYNDSGKMLKKILVKGYLGGYTSCLHSVKNN